MASDDKYVHYISDKKIDMFITAFIMSLGLVMLIAPLWVLAFLGGIVQRLSVISAFIVLFVALVSVATVAKPFESLAAAAAYVVSLSSSHPISVIGTRTERTCDSRLHRYSAVLMVFLQMSGTN